MDQTPPTTRKLDEQIQVLRDRGYTGELVRRDGQIVCRNCNSLMRAEDVPVSEEYHFPNEGEQGEEAVLQALTCPVCGLPGQLMMGHRQPSVPAQ